MAGYFLRLFKEAPFLRLLMPFIAGIFLSEKIRLPVAISLAIMSFIASFAIVYNSISGVSRYRGRSVAGIVISAQVFLLGSLLFSVCDIRLSRIWFAKNLSEAEKVLICVEEPPIAKDKTFKANATVRGLYTGGKMQAARGNFILYFPRRDSTLRIQYGSLLMVPPTFVPMTNSGNPGAFDYVAYCQLQNIYHQTFLRSNTYQVLTETDTRSIRKFIFSSQVKIIAILERFIGGAEAGLAEALLIGYKNNLDKSVLQQYAETGIIHVVAISGMHLGLIYWLLSLLLSSVEQRKTRWLRAILILSGLWIFTLLAGASASVVRSALMFTLLLAAELAARKSSSVNTLASSAFLLLSFNPFWLWDLGFQLSYAALGSIMIFMKPTYALLYVQNKGLDILWKMCATCIAAQVLTTPIVLLLTGRFPIFFLITNLVAIPVSSLIVLGEVSLCALSFITPIASPIGSSLSGLISFMNYFVFRMNQIPFGNLKELYQETATVCCIYCVIFCVSCAIKFRNLRCFIIALIFANAYAGTQLYYYHQASGQHLLIVYNTPGASIVELVNGRSSDRAQWMSNKALKEITDRVIEIAHNKLRINRHQKIFPDQGNTVLFRGKKIGVIRNADLKKVSSEDFLILSNISSGAAENLFASSIAATFIIDSSVPRAKALQWEASCKALGKTCYNVGSAGAFILNMN